MKVFLLLMVLLVLYDKGVQGNDCLNVCAKGGRRKGGCTAGVVNEWDLVSYLVDPRLRPANVMFSGNCGALGLVSMDHHQMKNYFGTRKPVVAITNGCLETTIHPRNEIPDTTCHPHPRPNKAAQEDIFWELQGQDQKLFDVTTLEFDIDIPSDCEPAFLYSFGSEEYAEFVSSSLYSDMFKLLVDGLDLSYLPGGVKVGVKTVNSLANSLYYLDNDVGNSVKLPMEWDGATTLLTSTSVTTTGKAHVVVSITDVGDPAYDSVVYLGRFTCSINPTASLKRFPRYKHGHAKHAHHYYEFDYEYESKKRDVEGEGSVQMEKEEVLGEDLKDFVKAH